MLRPATLPRLLLLRVPSPSPAPHRAILGGAKAFSSTPQAHLEAHLLQNNLKPTSPIVTKPHFFNSVTPDGSGIPTYRILDADGEVLDGAEAPEISEEMAVKMYENMVLLPTLDNVLYNVQRQGKISFYMTSYGEEATIIGSAAALDNQDEVLGQYREMGVLLWRGFTIDNVMAQCFGNEEDTSGKGRQMPVHFGSPAHHFHTISSPLATQIPQAAGVAYALKRDPERRGKNVAACYFGEGAASEGDFHAGLLLASTLPSPTVFIARNNGFAISTPSSEQFFGDGIASRGPGYGVHTIRVDGNDALAVLSAVRQARSLSLRDGRATLVECMSYRVGHHSTSDDSFAYRARSEVDERKREDDPSGRFRRWLEGRGWWNAEREKEGRERMRKEVVGALKRAEGVGRCELGELFGDVYAGEEPWMQREQRAELASLLRKYGKVWGPWKKELGKFKNGGEDLMGKV